MRTTPNAYMSPFYDTHNRDRGASGAWYLAGFDDEPHSWASLRQPWLAGPVQDICVAVLQLWCPAPTAPARVVDEYKAARGAAMRNHIQFMCAPEPRLPARDNILPSIMLGGGGVSARPCGGQTPSCSSRNVDAAQRPGAA
jgi:hypothetical protein